MTIRVYRNRSPRRLAIGRIPRRLPGSVNQRLIWLGPIFILIQGGIA